MTSAPPSSAPTTRRSMMSWKFHLMMTLITGGLWALFVWLPIAAVSLARKAAQPQARPR